MIIAKNATQFFTLGVVYAPDEVDAHNEYTTADEIQKACWEYNKNLINKSKVARTAELLLSSCIKAYDENKAIRIDISELSEEITKGSVNHHLGIMHKFSGENAGEVVESYITPCDMTINNEVIKQGTWMMGVVWEPAYFEKILDGTFTGYSMGGTGLVVTEKNSPTADQTHVNKPLGEEKPNTCKNCGKGKKLCKC
jgi:hypothetical protein